MKVKDVFDPGVAVEPGQGVSAGGLRGATKGVAVAA
jgi:hypothetical protein